MGSFISLLFISLGILAPFKPILLLYLFLTIPILSSLPLVPQESADLKIVQVGSANFYAADYLVVLLSLVLAVAILTRFIIPKRSLSSLFQSPITRAIAIVLLWNIVIGFLSLTKGFELQNVLRKLSREMVMLVAVLIPLMSLREEDRKHLYAYSIVLGLILVASGLIKYAITGEIEYTSSGTVRTLLGNSVIIFMLPICYLLFYSDAWNRHRFLAVVILAALSLGVSFAGHRSGFLVLLLVFALRYLMAVRYKIPYLWVPAAGLLLLGAVVFTPALLRTAPSQGIVSDAVIRFNDTFDIGNKTTQTRLANWQYLFTILEKSPLLGMGRFPAYEGLIEDSSASVKGAAELAGSSHNVLVDKFIHEGLLGLAVTLWFLSVLFRQGWSSAQLDRRYAQFFTVYLLSFVVFCLFNAAYSSDERVLLFVMAGILNATIIHAPRNAQHRHRSTAETLSTRRASAL